MMKLLSMITMFLILISFEATSHSSEHRGAKVLGDLPASAQASISAAIGREDTQFHAVKGANGWRTENRRHGLSAQFTGSAVTVSKGADQWTLVAASFGRGLKLSPVSGGEAVIDGNRVEYRHGNLTEWYVNGPLGIEQGFTIKDRPAGPFDEKLVLTMNASGLQAVESELGGLSLVRDDGSEAFCYGGVAAWDADGRSLPVQLALADRQVLLTFDDRYARYPLTVDPYFQGTILTASDGAGGDVLGYSVAISSDGTTVLVGAPGDDSSRGAAYVFTRSGDTWSWQTTLIAADGAAGDSLGFSVSMSGDGNTALIGAYGNDTFKGGAYVFTRSGSVWNAGTKLTAGDGAANDYFGSSVSMSGDGATALVGAINKASATGAAYVFTGGGTTWTEQQKLTASDSASGDRFAKSVSLCGDGDTALVGAYGKDSFKGAAYLFSRSGSVWGTGTKLTAGDAAVGDKFGTSVSVSSDGSTALIGASGTDSSAGAAYVFTGGGATWAEQQRLTASDSASDDRFGSSVSLSSDGNTALIGAYYKTSVEHSGVAYVFAGGGASWAEQQKLTASDPATGDNFGLSVALSGDGNTILSGAPYRNSSAGAAYVFDFVLPPTISKVFGAASINLNGTTSLMFTIHNPNTLTTLTGISFTDNLPAGLVVSTSPSIINDCGGAVTANAGSGTITLNGASLTSGGSCDLSVDVTGIEAGTWNNITENITSLEGGAGGSASASIGVKAILSVLFAGSGSGTVKSTSPDTAINCSNGSSTGCSAYYPVGTSVTLTATPDWNSLFGGWSGGATGSSSPVTFSLGSSQTVTATFNPAPLLQVGPSGYPTLQAAYDAAISGSIIQMLNNADVGTLDAERNVTVTLKGGYDPGYTNTTGTTKVTGPLIVGLGQITMDRIEIR